MSYPPTAWQVRPPKPAAAPPTDKNALYGSTGGAAAGIVPPGQQAQQQPQQAQQMGMANQMPNPHAQRDVAMGEATAMAERMLPGSTTSGGFTQRGTAVPRTPTAAGPDPGNNLKAPGQRETYFGETKDFYKQPTNTQTMFEAGQDQLNPYYDRAMNQGTEAINRQFGAGGGFNSGARLAAIADLGANLRGQQAMKQIDLGAEADRGMLARTMGGQEAAGSSDAGQIGRFNSLMNASLGLGGGEASSSQPYYNLAVTGSTPFMNESIQADMNADTATSRAIDRNIKTGAEFYKMK